MHNELEYWESSDWTFPGNLLGVANGPFLAQEKIWRWGWNKTNMFPSAIGVWIKNSALLNSQGVKFIKDVNLGGREGRFCNHRWGFFSGLDSYLCVCKEWKSLIPVSNFSVHSWKKSWSNCSFSYSQWVFVVASSVTTTQKYLLNNIIYEIYLQNNICVCLIIFSRNYRDLHYRDLHYL